MQWRMKSKDRTKLFSWKKKHDHKNTDAVRRIGWILKQMACCLSLYNLWKYDFQLKLKLKDGGHWWLVNCLSGNMCIQHVSCLLCNNWLPICMIYVIVINSSTSKTFYLFKSDDMLWCAQECFSMPWTHHHSNNNWIVDST